MGKVKNILKNTYTNTMDYLEKQGTKFEQATVFTPKKNGGYQLNPRIKSTINEVKESLPVFNISKGTANFLEKAGYKKSKMFPPKIKNK